SLENEDLEKAREFFDEFITTSFHDKSKGKNLLEYCKIFNMMILECGNPKYILNSENKNKDDTNNLENLQKVEKLYILMQDKKVMPNGDTKSVMKIVFKRNFEHFENETLSWFNGLIDKGKVDSGLIKEIVIILSNKKKFDKAIKILDKMKSLEMEQD